VEACAHLDPELAHVLGDRARAPDCARWAVEAGKESVPGGIELPTAKAKQPTADQGMVLLE